MSVRPTTLKSERLDVAQVELRKCCDKALAEINGAPGSKGTIQAKANLFDFFQSVIVERTVSGATKLELVKAAVGYGKNLQKKADRLDQFALAFPEEARLIEESVRALESRQIAEYLAHRPKRLRHPTPEQRHASITASKARNERRRRNATKTHEVAGSIEAEFAGISPLLSMPMLGRGKAETSYTVDELHRGSRVKTAGDHNSLERLFAVERHRFKGCLPPMSRAGYDYVTFLKIATKLLTKKQWLPDPGTRRVILSALTRRADEISPPAIKKAVAKFVKQQLSETLNSGK